MAQTGLVCVWRLIAGENLHQKAMYLNLRWPEQRADVGIIMYLRLVLMVIPTDRPGFTIKIKRGSYRDEKESRLLQVNLFERQLHVFFIVVVVHVIAPIMHREKIKETDFLIQRFVFGEMLHKRRQLENLAQRGCVKNHNDHQNM